MLPEQYVEREADAPPIEQPRQRRRWSPAPCTPRQFRRRRWRDAHLIPRFADDRDKAPFSTRCILVVEDEPNFAHILYDLAHELGYHCLVAHGADEGYELADAVPARRHPAGHAPAGPFRADRAAAPEGRTPNTRHIPVHVISVEDRVEAALHMGAIGYAVKPTTREELKDVFARLEAKLTQKVKRVLLVEDDDLQRDSVARLIGDDDIEITAVGFGPGSARTAAQHGLSTA